MADYVVCPGCGGDADDPRPVNLIPFAVEGVTCRRPFHSGGEPGHELRSEHERARLLERRRERRRG